MKTPMKTPITDAVFGPQLRGYRAETCRKLEADRAALMEALEQVLGCISETRGSDATHAVFSAQFALSAARANFPEP